MTESNTKTCNACAGTHEVMSIDGYMRPCSRCRSGAFHDWYAARVAEKSRTPPPPAEKAE